MKSVTIQAHDKNKVFLGEFPAKEPETIEECLEVEGGSEKEVVKHYWGAKVIALRSTLHRPAPKVPETENEKAFKRLSHTQQNEALALMDIK